MYVSVSAYRDHELLDGCLASIRDVLPDADIDVVDGRYESWPDAPDNSPGPVDVIASGYGARYVAGGPYHRENDKHEHRVKLAPNGERAIFLDADERLLEVNEDALDEETSYSPRIYNAAVYGPTSVYWPRIFYPEYVQSINRWDAYLFDVPHENTDAVTIIHRHDLRDRDYREAKYQRFNNEGRRGRYEDSFEQYLEDDWNVDMEECPECGRESLTRSQVTNYGPDEAFSSVECCVAADGCHAAINRVQPGEWQYLPDDWECGFQEDPERLRIELMDAGCEFVRKGVPTMQNMAAAVKLWIDDRFGGADHSDVFRSQQAQHRAND